MAFNWNELFATKPEMGPSMPSAGQRTMDQLRGYNHDKSTPDQRLKMLEAASQTEEVPAMGRGDGWKALLEWGLATMAAGAKPGATTLGAIGEGGLAATGAMEKRRDKKQGRKDKEAERMQKVLGDFLGMQEADKKFDYQAGQDTIANALRERGLGLEEQRLNQPDFESYSDANGQLFQIPKRGGAAQPVSDASGQPIKGMSQSEKLIMELMGRAITDPNAMDEDKAANAQLIQQMLGSRNSSTPALSAGGGDDPRIDAARKAGYSEQEIQDYLKRIQGQ